MSRRIEKLLLQILSGTGDTNIAFDDLRKLLSGSASTSGFVEAVTFSGAPASRRESTFGATDQPRKPIRCVRCAPSSSNTGSGRAFCDAQI